MSHLEMLGSITTSCGYHRILLPFSRLRDVPKVPTLVFNRYVPGGASALQQKRREGYCIVADLDDLWDLPRGHYLADSWNAAGTPARIRECLAVADVVLVTNAELAGHVTAVNPRVVVVPNALPFDEGQFTRNTVAGATFVYAAGASHVPDVEPLAAVFNRADVVFAGVEDRHPEWRRMGRLVPLAKRVQAQRISEYMGLYEGHLAALAPLADNAFNRCKSNLKMLEAGARGIPLLASDITPYRTGVDAQYALLATDVEGWRANMRMCLAYPRLAAELGVALAAHVREHYHLDKVNEIRRQVLESLT